jgi:hypothetical protein
MNKSSGLLYNRAVSAACDASNRFVKLPDAHRELISDATLAMYLKFPDKTEEEYHLAVSRLATAVRSHKEGNQRIWTLKVPELGQRFVRVVPA